MKYTNLGEHSYLVQDLQALQHHDSFVAKVLSSRCDVKKVTLHEPFTYDLVMYDGTTRKLVIEPSKQPGLTTEDVFDAHLGQEAPGPRLHPVARMAKERLMNEAWDDVVGRLARARTNKRPNVAP